MENMFNKFWSTYHDFISILFDIITQRIVLIKEQNLNSNLILLQFYDLELN